MRRALLPAALLLALVPAPALAAEGDPVTGWWSRTKVGAGAPAETPDTVPEGGTQVAGDPAGELSVTAVRVQPADGTVVTGLRLAVARATGTPDVQVCATAARWQPVDGGRLDAAPPADCSGATVKAVVAEGVLAVDLPPSPGPVDVRLQPAAGSVFSLDLAPATAQSVVTAPAPAAPAAEEPAAPAAPAPAAPAPADAPLPAAPPVAPVQAPGVAEEAVALPPLVGADAPPVPADALPPALPGPPPAALGEPAAPVSALLPRPAEGLDGRREQLWAVALLAGLLALAAQLYRTPARAAVRLGGAARLSRAGEEPVPPPVAAPGRERGVGRWRSERVRPPVPL